MENIFFKGGVFMWPLLFCLVITFVVIIERWLYWLKTKIDNNYGLRQAFMTSNQRVSILESMSNEQNDSTIVLAYKAIQQKQLSKVEIDNLLKYKQVSHDRFMRLLDVIISVAPLLGILGTIWGIINSFNLVGIVNDIDPATAMIGMSEAFITTAFGLIVSLFALFAFNFFQSLTEKELVNNDIFLTNLLVNIESSE